MDSGRAGMCCAVAAIIGSGCNSETPQAHETKVEPSAQVLAAERKVYAIGELATSRDYTMSIAAAEPCAVPPPFSARPGYEKLGVTVVIEGTSGRQVPANPFYATLNDSNGATYSSTLAGCRPPLEARVVKRGEKVKGIITFEVPASANRFEMSYTPAIIGGGRQELRFDLGP